MLIHAAAEILFFEKGKLSDDIEKNLLKIASQVNPQNKGTIAHIDRFLSSILTKNRFDEIIEHLEDLFERTDYEISISDFGMLTREACKDDFLLSKLITRWFLSKKSCTWSILP